MVNFSFIIFFIGLDVRIRNASAKVEIAFRQRYVNILQRYASYGI